MENQWNQIWCRKRVEIGCYCWAGNPPVTLQICFSCCSYLRVAKVVERKQIFLHSILVLIVTRIGKNQAGCSQFNCDSSVSTIESGESGSAVTHSNGRYSKPESYTNTTRYCIGRPHCQSVCFCTNFLHWAAVLRITRNICGSLFSLFLSSTSPLALWAYFDSDWAADVIDRKSTFGFCFFLEILLYLEKVKNSVFLLLPRLRQCVMLWLLLLQRLFGYGGFSMILESFY